jgi:glucosamine kinase
MLNPNDIVIGIDGGGTHTRVMVTDLSGNVLSYVEKGSASIYKDLDAKQTVHHAIWEAITIAGREVHEVRGIAAGVAGYDSESDLEWVESLTDIEGLSCSKWHVNDAVVAHFGALKAKPGIVAISGTGSIILAISEDDTYLRNYDFRHYAASSARSIAYDAAFEILAGKTNETDCEMVQSMLQHWNVQTITEFGNIAKKGFLVDQRECNRKFGQFAPTLTEAAWQGSSLAKRVCDRAIDQIKVGIEMLAAFFSGKEVPVVFIGSVINSPYFNEKLSEQLLFGNNKRFLVVKPQFSPVAGAVLMGLDRLQIATHGAVIENLQKSGFCRG